MVSAEMMLVVASLVRCWFRARAVESRIWPVMTMRSTASLSDRVKVMKFASVGDTLIAFTAVGRPR